MDWLEYKEKLGIAANDGEKLKIFINNIVNTLKRHTVYPADGLITNQEYLDFCNTTGSIYDPRFSDSHSSRSRMTACIKILQNHAHSPTEFIACYIALINSLKIGSHQTEKNRNFLVSLLKQSLTNAHLPFEVLREGNNYFCIPNGVAEFDTALVVQPLQWLEDYPNAHKTFCTALRQYSEGIYIRDVADNLRKALEEFLREFLKNEKGLNENKREIGKYFKSQNVNNSEFVSFFQKVIDTYDTINNKYAKHYDKIDARLLEFLLYETGLLIRMVLKVKQIESE